MGSFKAIPEEERDELRARLKRSNRLHEVVLSAVDALELLRAYEAALARIREFEGAQEASGEAYVRAETLRLDKDRAVLSAALGDDRVAFRDLDAVVLPKGLPVFDEQGERGPVLGHVLESRVRKNADGAVLETSMKLTDEGVEFVRRVWGEKLGQGGNHAEP